MVSSLARKLSLPVIAIAVLLAGRGWGQAGSGVATARPAEPELTTEARGKVLAGIEEVLRTRAFVPGVDFKAWTEFIGKRQDALDKLETHNAFAAEINRALREFGLSHIRLLTPRAAAQRGKTTAIGVGITARKVEGGLVVVRLAEAGPAKKAAIAEGELIVSVNGKPAETQDQLAGNEGERLRLEVKGAKGEIREVEVPVVTFSTVRKETLTWVDEETAVLRVFTFSTGYSRANIEQLLKQASVKARFLVLDLRSNGGGAVGNLQHLLSLLMPIGTEYGHFINRANADRFARENAGAPLTFEAFAAWNKSPLKTIEITGSAPFAGKIAVLTNRGSASASEIAAASLREGVSAVIVGQPTAGAVLASVFRPLPEKYSIQYPVSDYITKSRIRLEKNPVKPDIEVPSGAGDGDSVLSKAVAALKERTRHNLYFSGRIRSRVR